VPQEIGSSQADQGIRFFLEHFILGHPDEPRAGPDLQGRIWIHRPEIQHTMAAVGLASLSNLRGDKEMFTLARQKYGLALQTTASSLQTMKELDLEASIRNVVMLALFEVIQGNALPQTAAQTHVIGAAALLSSILPVAGPYTPAIPRALLQLCFSMLIPSLFASVTLSDSFFAWVALSSQHVQPFDKPAAELIGILARLVQISVSVQTHVLIPGRSTTYRLARELLELDSQLEAWEQRQHGIWVFHEECAPVGFFPAAAVFECSYHVYSDMWTARVWNHYRWARVLVNQMILDFAKLPLDSSTPSSPNSSTGGSINGTTNNTTGIDVDGTDHQSSTPNPPPPAISPDQQARSLDCIAQVVRQFLVSIPTHYRHPSLQREHREHLDKTMGGAGMGAAGLPPMLFQLKVAGCAPGIPPPYLAWMRDLLDAIWADTGIMQAKALADVLGQKADLRTGAAGMASGKGKCPATAPVGGGALAVLVKQEELEDGF